MNATEARAIFDGMKIAFPDLVRTVVSDGKTAYGLRDVRQGKSNLAVEGEIGVSTGHVIVDSAEMDDPAKGATITVNGELAFVMDSQPDPTGALIEIGYQLQRPITGPDAPQ